MKKLKAPLFGVLLLVAAVSCQKDKINDAPLQESSEVSSLSNSENTEIGWQSQQNWTKVEQPSYTVFYTNIKSSAVTSDASENGLVRVFKADDNTPVSLPFEETVGSQKLYWYYQVTEGNIMIAVDVYGDRSNPAQSALFKQVVLDKQAIASFEAKGTSKVELMNLSYDKLIKGSN